MAYKVLETELAVRDLDHIFAYMVHSLDNPSAAASFADALEKCYSYLEQAPLMFEECHNPRLRMLGYRKAAVKNYLLIYKVEENTKTVSVLRFFHGRRDYERLL